MPLLPILSRAGSVSARALRAGLIALSALFLVTCTDNPIAPGRTGRLLIQPMFSGSALFAPLAIDNIRLIVIRPPSEVIKTITQPFPSTSNSVRITATDIPLSSTSEDLLVTIELYAGTTLLFSGTQTVTVTAGVTPQPAPIPMLYQGPGANLTTLALAPRDTTVRPGGVFTYQVTAADAQQQPVTSFYVGWQASAGTITGTGQFTAPATRDTITITVSAPAPNSTKDSTRVFVIAAPGNLAITGGDGQTAVAGTRLPQLLAVQVNGTDGLPLPGVTVTFAATTGGGSVDSATATTDAQGIARTGATLGSLVGAQTFTASSAGLTSVVFNEIASNPGGGITWNGSLSTAWNTAGNWTPATVPGLADNVTVPAGPSNQPVVSITANLNDLTIAAGATVTLNGSFTFNVAGNLAANGSLVVSSGTPTIQLSGTAKTLVGNIASATITGTVALAGTTNVSGNVAVSGGAARLDIGGNTMQIGGGFSAGSGGRLGMTTSGDQLNIAGSAAFGGGDETGLLTAGTLTIGGNFTQSGSGSPTSFVGSGTHTVFLSGTGAQTINFGTPGFAASRFQNVIIDNTVGGVTATSDLYATGTPGATPTAVRTLSGNGSTLFTTILDVSNFTLNNLLVDFAGGPLVGFDTVTFQGYAPTATPLTISHPGAGGPFTFFDVTFTVTPTTGFYISATDANPADGVPLVINMTNPTPASPGGRVQTAGGATVNWPAAGGKIWNGTTNNWNVATNWNPQGVPTTADDVVIPPTANPPTVTASCAAKSLTVNTGATLDLGTINCQVLGNVVADGVITGTGALGLPATSQIRGNLPSLIVSGPVTASGTINATGNLTVTGTTGNFIVGGQAVGIGGNLQTQSSAVLTMTNALGQLSVNGNASFGGGNELGLMSAGLLIIGGNFTQIGSGSGDSFHPSGTHLTVLSGASPTITFGTPGDVPGTSHFQGFSWTGTGTLTLGSDVYSHGEFSTSSTAPVTVSSAAGRLLQIGSHTGAGPITFNNVRLSLREEAIGSPLALANATFSGLAGTATQLTVAHSGAGGPFTFANINFQTQPSTGFYISATDLDGPSVNGALTIYMVSPNPAAPSTFLQQLNGAQVLWPATGNTFTWTGGTDTDWFKPGNWDRNAVPGAIDDVILNPTTNQPALTTSAGVNNITSTTGSILDLKGFVLVADGNVDLAGSIVDGVGGGGVTLTGSAGLVRGTISAEVAVVGSYVMNGSIIISGNLSVQGSLELGGFTAQVGGSFLTFGNGVLRMINSLDVLDVTGDAIFNGGSTAGLLKSGRITVAGNFSQIGTNSKQSFAADPGHLTQLSANPVTITFTDPGPTLSHFGNLAESGFGATFNLNSDVTVLGFLSGGDGFGGTMVGTCPTVLTLTGFSTSGPLNLNCVQLVVDDPGGTNIGINGVTFTGLPTNVTQLTIRHPGLAAGNFTTGSLTFVPLAINDTGFYIQVVDTDASAPFLTVSPLATNVTNGPSFTTSVGGGSVLWP